MLSVSLFSARRAWLTDRLASMLSEATGAKPLMYYTPNGQVILIAGKGHSPSGPAQIRDYLSLDWAPGGTAQATDDWPYLYLRSRAIPMDYLLIIGFLTVVSALFVLTSSGRGEKHLDLHFFFLGAGFLLLETKSITTLSLYFGTTWFVSMIAIAGVLIYGLLGQSRGGEAATGLTSVLCAVGGLDSLSIPLSRERASGLVVSGEARVQPGRDAVADLLRGHRVLVDLP